LILSPFPNGRHTPVGPKWCSTRSSAKRQVARFYLALDQGMAMAGAVNALTGDRQQKLFAPAIEQRVRPLLAMEQFGAG
jgi:hypothetical protein